MTLASAKKKSSHLDKTIEEVCISLDGKALVVLFANGEGYKVSRHQIPGDDQSPITHIEIFDHGCAVAIKQASGCYYDLPWDSIKHYAQSGKRKKTHIGSLLRRLREKSALSQGQLASRSGLSRAQINRLEQNLCEPSIETLEKLSKVFNLKPVDLLNA